MFAKEVSAGQVSAYPLKMESLKSFMVFRELLKGVIIQSGNDACITLAENLAGSEDNFAAEMTIKAREIGLEKSTFKNSTGWPHKEHLMTAKELALLAQKIIHEFPEYYPLYSEKKFKYNGINQENRNPLLYSMPDQADGLKTGHTARRCLYAPSGTWSRMTLRWGPETPSS